MPGLSATPRLEFGHPPHPPANPHRNPARPAARSGQGGSGQGAGIPAQAAASFPQPSCQRRAAAASAGPVLCLATSSPDPRALHFTPRPHWLLFESTPFWFPARSPCLPAARACPRRDSPSLFPPGRPSLHFLLAPTFSLPPPASHPETRRPHLEQVPPGRRAPSVALPVSSQTRLRLKATGLLGTRDCLTRQEQEKQDQAALLGFLRLASWSR